MRFIEDLCQPALLYAIFLAVNLGLDLSLGLWYTALFKTVFGVAVIVLLNTFCDIGLGVVSWFLVAAPFVITALATAISIGVRFDESMTDKKTKEKFEDKKNPTVPGFDAPVDSNAIETVSGV